VSIRGRLVRLSGWREDAMVALARLADLLPRGSRRGSSERLERWLPVLESSWARRLDALDAHVSTFVRPEPGETRRDLGDGD
jgi:hypothetical protein